MNAAHLVLENVIFEIKEAGMKVNNRYHLKRLLKVSLLFSCASLLSLGCISNMIAYDINFDYVKNIMSMNDTFHHPVVMLRAVNNPIYYHIAYILIILCEAFASILLWKGIYHCLKNISQPSKQFETAKYWGEVGLLISLFLYIFAFFFIAGEWFASWQSAKWNAKNAAMPFIVTLGLTYLIFSSQENEEI